MADESKQLTPAEREQRIWAEIKDKWWMAPIELRYFLPVSSDMARLQEGARRLMRRGELEPFRYVLMLWAADTEQLRRLPYAPHSTYSMTALQLADEFARILPPAIDVYAPFKIRLNQRRKGAPRKPRNDRGVIAELENRRAQLLRDMFLGRLWMPQVLEYVAEMINEDGDTPCRMELIRDEKVEGEAPRRKPDVEFRELLTGKQYHIFRRQGLSPEAAIAEIQKLRPLSERSILDAITKFRNPYELSWLRAQGMSINKPSSQADTAPKARKTRIRRQRKGQKKIAP